MDGIWVNGRRPETKKQVREACVNAPETVEFDWTSIFDHPNWSRLKDMPECKVNFVGPDPYNSRKFYGTVTKKNGEVKVT